MLLLVSGATATIPKHDVGVLVVPRQWNLVESLPLLPGRWAMDNGAFAGFEEGAFMRMLERFAGQSGCLFVTAPDVVGDAAATLRRFPFWQRVIQSCGFPVALVLQDGLTIAAVPWADVGAVFVGGSTEFKESPEAETLVSYAKARGLWTHMGRVNSKRRLRIAQRWGIDSYDGTGVNIAPDVNIPKMIRFDRETQAQQEIRW